MPDIMPYPTRCRTARFPLSGSAAFDLMCVDQSDTKMGGAKKHMMNSFNMDVIKCPLYLYYISSS